MQTSDPPDNRAVLGAVKAQPGDAQPAVSQGRRQALTAAARDAIDVLRTMQERRRQFDESSRNARPDHT